MNKYIKTDIDTANTSLKAATNNVLHAIENGEIDSFDFVSHYPLSLMYEVLSQRGFFNVIKEHFTIDAIISSYDNGKNVTTYDDPNDSVDDYIDLIQNSYLVNGKTLADLMTPGKFTNGIGKRFASDSGYENKIKSLRNRILRTFPDLA